MQHGRASASTMAALPLVGQGKWWSAFSGTRWWGRQPFHRGEYGDPPGVREVVQKSILLWKRRNRRELGVSQLFLVLVSSCLCTVIGEYLQLKLKRWLLQSNKTETSVGLHHAQHLSPVALGPL